MRELMMQDEAKKIVEELPKAVLMWHPFLEGHKGAVVVESNMGELSFLDSETNYVIVTSDWEKHKEPVQLFKEIKDKLSKESRLFLLMHNRLGIRYFCGDMDPYGNKNLDCLENYKNMENTDFKGKMYSKNQIKHMLEQAGFNKTRFYSLFSGLENPALILAEGYYPNENLTNRVIPTYNNPQTIFLEEQLMYQQLTENGMLHELANAYLVECATDGEFCDVNQVTSSLERGREDALFTIIHASGVVEKKAAYPEGEKRLAEIASNLNYLKGRGIKVIDIKRNDSVLLMPYCDGEIAQRYFETLLRDDLEKFLAEMDAFRDIILQSSEQISKDSGDGKGAVLKCGFMDLVPLNCIRKDGEFVFFDQEFCEENFSANILVWRMVASFYAADYQADKIYPMQKLLERYGLVECLEQWQNAEWDFLKALRKEHVLADYHKQVRADGGSILENKERMRYSDKEYKSKFVDIFSGCGGKRLILFGTGKYAMKFMELYGRDFPVLCFLDNNTEKQGELIQGIKVEAPQYLAELDKEECKIVICMKNYKAVADQLDQMGWLDYAIYDASKYYMTRPRTMVLVEGEDKSIEKKYKVGYVAGAFDMFHIGHLNLLRRAKSHCDYLIAGVMSDDKMFELKGKKPIISCMERMQVVAGCRYVDRVEELPIDRAGIRDAYHAFHFDCMFSGDDHSNHPGWLADREYLREKGSDIVFLPYTKETSSTEIRNKMTNYK